MGLRVAWRRTAGAQGSRRQHGTHRFHARELDTLLRDPKVEEKADLAPPLPAFATSQPSDLWLLGTHRVLCGDCTRPENVARLPGDRRPPLLGTGPPHA